MTPAVTALSRAGIPHKVHRYDVDERSDLGWGEEAAAALGVDAAVVFKTLIIALSGARSTHAVAVIPVSCLLDLRQVAADLGAKRAAMADPDDARRLTGYIPGGISPFGQKRRLPLALDICATRHYSIHVSGGRRGLEIEISPDDFVRATGATLGAIAQV